ncbi:alpha/beta hydrolase [Thermopirellula anaerolimosa]
MYARTLVAALIVFSPLPTVEPAASHASEAGADTARRNAAARRSAIAADSDIQADRVVVFKKIDDVSLSLYVFFPDHRVPAEPRPGIVFFFGGGFVSGSPKQFEPHCRYLSQRGMVAVTAEYRVKNRHGTTPLESFRDGKSAVRWIRLHAEELGIDPNKLAAGGGSAGGMVAAVCGVVPGWDEPGEDLAVSSRPDAMVLFNPAVMGKALPDRQSTGQLGVATEILPYYHIREGLPPAIMFFGDRDRFLAGARDFQKAAEEKGNRCELKIWPGFDHGFFNFGRGDNRAFRETLLEADRFLSSLGYLQGEPRPELLP